MPFSVQWFSLHYSIASWSRFSPIAPDRISSDIHRIAIFLQRTTAKVASVPLLTGRDYRDGLGGSGLSFLFWPAYSGQSKTSIHQPRRALRVCGTSLWYTNSGR